MEKNESKKSSEILDSEAVMVDDSFRELITSSLFV